MRITGMIVAVMMLAACRAEPDAAKAPPASPSQPSPSVAAEPAPAVPEPPATPRDFKLDNTYLTFDYAYPAVAAQIPGLKAWLDAEGARLQERETASARAQNEEFTRDGIPWRPLAFDKQWKVVADTGAFLSLSATIYQFTGGAHGMSGFDALLWDRAANVRRDPADLFYSSKTLSSVIRKPFCAELDRQRAKKREGAQMSGSIPEFSECVDPAEHVIILGSTNGKTFDRIGVLVEPYAAGPYAEGSYDVTVPVTDAVLAAVRPEFRQAFSTR